MINTHTTGLRLIVENTVPLSIRRQRVAFLNGLLKRKILACLKKDLVCGDHHGEKKEIYTFLKKNALSIFPYEFIKKYKPDNISVYTDKDCNMNYVLHENKRLYFKSDWTEKQIKEYYNGLLIEQDMDSPHRYEYGDFKVNAGDVVVDVGAAEGNFALSVVEQAKKIVLFEVDEGWISALKKTFEPWSEKVVIVDKYVSDKSTENEIRLDDYFVDEHLDFLKLDVESMEIQVLQGAKKLLSKQKKTKIAICTYHRQHDAETIRIWLETNGFQTEFSKGYMLFFLDKGFSAPWLRKALIRATSPDK